MPNPYKKFQEVQKKLKTAPWMPRSAYLAWYNQMATTVWRDHFQRHNCVYCGRAYPATLLNYHARRFQTPICCDDTKACRRLARKLKRKGLI